MLAIFPGTFDPVTRGHTDLVRRAVTIFDKVIIGVLENSAKQTLFSVEERLESIRAEFSDIPKKVEAISFSGLLVDFARAHGARVVIRGLRAISDYEYEAQMALMNKQLYDEMETFFMVSREEYSYVSSTIVRQVASLHGAVEKIVSPRVEALLRAKFQRPRSIPKANRRRRK